MTSSSRAIGDAVRRSDRSLRARAEGQVAFRSLERVLTWYLEYREKVQAAKSPQYVPDRDIEGGRGSNLAEVLATLSTIQDGIRDLEKANPRGLAILFFVHRDGLSYRVIAEKTGLSHPTVGAELGRAEAFLDGWLRRAEVIL